MNPSQQSASVVQQQQVLSPWTSNSQGRRQQHDNDKYLANLIEPCRTTSNESDLRAKHPL